jgi:predicted nucleic acid-binding protein
VNVLLDTNVISEWAKPRPEPRVVEWLAGLDEDRAFISVVTLAELRYGVERLPSSSRRSRLQDWLSTGLAERFDGRVLAVDNRVADAWGVIVARRDRGGRPISVMDAFVAATAQVHDLALVTRNADDFVASVKTVLNPWT